MFSTSWHSRSPSPMRSLHLCISKYLLRAVALHMRLNGHPSLKGLRAILHTQSQYWTGNGAHRYVPVLEFADAFEKSAIGRARTEDLATPFDKASTAGKDPLVYSKYELSSESPRPFPHSATF